MLRRVRFLPAHRSSVSPARRSGPMSRALSQKKTVYARCLPRAQISNYSQAVCFPRDSTWEHKGHDGCLTRQTRDRDEDTPTAASPFLCCAQARTSQVGEGRDVRNALSPSADHQTLTQLFAYTSCLHRSRPETAGAHAERWGDGWRG